MIHLLRISSKHLLLLACALPIACWGQPTAATTSGPVQGQIVNDIAVFRGLPFAAPPVGDRRWREPQPVQPWSDVRQTTALGPSCPQKRGLSLEGGGDPGQLDEDMGMQKKEQLEIGLIIILQQLNLQIYKHLYSIIYECCILPMRL